MANKIVQEIRVNTTRYLDEDGLKELWKKIKAYVSENAANINPEDINVDLSNYVTKEQLNEALENIDTGNIDLSGYVTKEALALELLNYAKKNHTHSQYLTSQSLDGYATEDYVTDAINNAQLSGGDVNIDLSIYAKTEDMNKALNNKSEKGHKHVMADITDYVEPEGTNIDVVPSEAYVGGDYDKVPTYGLLVDMVIDTAVKDHKHTMSDITNYSEPDLSDYATKQYVEDKVDYIEAIVSGENIITDNNPLRKLVTIDGTRVYTKNDIPAIPTYNGSTTLTFENEVILRVLKADEDGMYSEEEYEEYTGSTIVIPDTTEGYLTDYIIYNILPQPSGSETIVDPNIMTAIEDYTNMNAIYNGFEGYACYSSKTLKRIDWNEDNILYGGFSPVFDTADGIDSVWSFDTARVVLNKDTEDRGDVYETNTWYLQPTANERSKAVLWKDNHNAFSKFIGSDGKIFGVDDFVFDISRTDDTTNNTWDGYTIRFDESVRSGILPYVVDDATYNKKNAKHQFTSDTNLRTVMVCGRLDETYTVESITGKNFAIWVPGFGLEYRKRIWYPVKEYVDTVWDITWKDIYNIVGWVEGGIDTTLQTASPACTSLDGRAITFTLGEFKDGYEDQDQYFHIICEDEADYESIRITKGTFSYSELAVNTSALQKDVTSSNGSNTSDVTFAWGAYTTENDYIKYSNKDMVKVYDLDNIPDTSSFLTEVPEEYVTETEMTEAINAIPSVDLTGYLRYEIVTAAPETQEEGVLYIVTG